MRQRAAASRDQQAAMTRALYDLVSEEVQVECVPTPTDEPLGPTQLLSPTSAFDTGCQTALILCRACAELVAGWLSGVARSHLRSNPVIVMHQRGCLPTAVMSAMRCIRWASLPSLGRWIETHWKARTYIKDPDAQLEMCEFILRAPVYAVILRRFLRPLCETDVTYDVRKAACDQLAAWGHPRFFADADPQRYFWDRAMVYDMFALAHVLPTDTQTALCAWRQTVPFGKFSIMDGEHRDVYYGGV